MRFLPPLKLTLYFAFILVLGLYAYSQRIVSNGALPLNQKEERVLTLNRVAMTHDREDGFIFKKPFSLSPATDGSFYIIDNGQVLKFAGDGTYLRAIVNKGQGPGEATHLTQLLVHDNKLIVNTGFMGKLMVFDLEGNLISEFSSSSAKTYQHGSLSVGQRIYRILGCRKDNRFIIMQYGSSSKKSSNSNIKPRQLILLSPGNVFLKNLMQIPLPAVQFETGLGVKRLAVMPVISGRDRKYIYFCNTERYEIKRYDMMNDKIDAVWKRKFEPVAIPGDITGKINYGESYMSGSRNGKTLELAPPSPKDYLDIQKIFVVGNRLWVVTSYVSPGKGVLVDVFNLSGQYTGNFFLSFKDNLDINLHLLFFEEMAIEANKLYLRQRNSEGNFVIGIYESPKIRMDG